MKVDGNPFPMNMVRTSGKTADSKNYRSKQLNYVRIINKYQRKHDRQEERLGPIHQDYFQDSEDEDGTKKQWCPSGIFTKNQKRRVQRMRNREQFQEVQEEINHRLKKAKPKQEWCVKSKVVSADEIEADKVKRLAKGKSVASTSVNMVFVLPAEFGISQAHADADVVEESLALLVLSPEQAIFEKPEGTENRQLKPLYLKGFVNGKPMSKMLVDGGAAVNLMPYATFTKLGKNSDDLIKTNMVLKDFGGYRPYKQPPRRCKADMYDAIKAEITHLYDAGFIRPCRYAEYLNKATPKDEYPMPIADQLVDAASGHKIICFMDGNAGYNQIFMAEEDIHKTAFRCPGEIGLYEWVVMTFGLKSAGATYQRAMNYIFHDLIDLLVEIYIDDVVVKSRELDDHIANLRKVFERTRKNGLKMNPTKCAFGVSAGQFLGFLVHERGIEVTQRSINAIKNIEPPEDKNKLQSWVGKINFIRRFISNLSGRMEPFTPLLRGACFEFAYTIKPYATNNQVEYEAVLKGLQLLKEVEANAIEIMEDSLLVISQLAGEYECKSDTLMIYNEKCRELMGGFRLVTLKHVSREQNIEANDLAQGASGYKPMVKDVDIEVATITVDDWRKLRYKALRYVLLEDELYYRTIDGVLLKCLSIDQAKVVMGEMHEGICATDYFTKWVQAIPLKKVDSRDAIQFVKVHIIYRFGVPQTITTNQGSIFVSDEFVQFAESMGIKLLNSSPYYAQANGQAEASNKSLIKLIKRKIADYPKQWHNRLAEALWAYQMACHGSIQVPPYKLVYGHAMGN
uniref:Retrotransposon protein, putative, unclassified n=1 Tax=Oryza sativa subsp. japonica TaxID=39947 RepID=Q2RB69_ORYSJ|nr:retrotransposon protein, putative, unclassified [Oryza sativa Japonica Group]